MTIFFTLQQITLNKRSFIWTNIEFFNPKNNLAKNIFIFSTLKVRIKI